MGKIDENKEPITAMFANALKDMEKVVDFGGQKHGYGSWKDPDNPSLQRKANFASINRHISQGFCCDSRDLDTGVHHYLHAACRLLMEYERKVRGIPYSPSL